ncbi:hypothetical protein SNEBB_005983 [Seison nebaliae]|nr:hypothetical protein SNEBB_005983 [Seison nebaliae]
MDERSSTVQERVSLEADDYSEIDYREIKPLHKRVVLMNECAELFPKFTPNIHRHPRRYRLEQHSLKRFRPDLNFLSKTGRNYLERYMSKQEVQLRTDDRLRAITDKQRKVSDHKLNQTSTNLSTDSLESDKSDSDKFRISKTSKWQWRPVDLVNNDVFISQMKDMPITLTDMYGNEKYHNREKYCLQKIPNLSPHITKEHQRILQVEGVKELKNEKKVTLFTTHNYEQLSPPSAIEIMRLQDLHDEAVYQLLAKVDSDHLSNRPLIINETERKDVKEIGTQLDRNELKGFDELYQPIIEVILGVAFQQAELELHEEINLYYYKMLLMRHEYNKMNIMAKITLLKRLHLNRDEQVISLQSDGTTTEEVNEKNDKLGDFKTIQRNKKKVILHNAINNRLSTALDLATRKVEREKLSSQLGRRGEFMDLLRRKIYSSSIIRLQDHQIANLILDELIRNCVNPKH